MQGPSAVAIAAISMLMGATTRGWRKRMPAAEHSAYPTFLFPHPNGVPAAISELVHGRPGRLR